MFHPTQHHLNLNTVLSQALRHDPQGLTHPQACAFRESCGKNGTPCPRRFRSVPL